MSSQRMIRDEGTICQKLRAGAWIEYIRRTKRAILVESLDDPGALIDPKSFERLGEAGLLKRAKIGRLMVRYAASDELLAEEAAP